MASPSDPASLASLKAKQERIRDNQRRSRARRQEYTIELEQRLEQCRITCREADLLRQSFQDLQAENSRLRGLLNTAGVSPVLVDSFLRQRSTEQSSSTSNNPSNLRQLKPKISPHAISTNAMQPLDARATSSTVPKSTRRAVSQTRSSTDPSSCCPEVTRSSSTSELLRPNWESTNLLNEPLPLGSSSDVPPLPSPTTIGPLTLDWTFDPGSDTKHSAQSSVDDSITYWDNFAIDSAEYLLPDDTINVASSARTADP
ncbi:hypothetical protein EDD37DRAFT_410611 [Exophiala viscosa]|uniref:BZIP domain-containing protein n=1 Tax=Exophiala viscosa TaxID=2486360 RepID=A0AAN6DXY6_9EURO|nr:hypothetical protein EDD36DRAFT_462247 [Exophiala viscosa]KAI1624390.1 hypothetical protein EDD37DRAFT_410611 [Exophiala viscosa]